MCFLLGWIGSLPVMAPFFEIGQFVTVGFFLFFLLFSLMGVFEKVVYIHYSEAALRIIRSSMHNYTR